MTVAANQIGETVHELITASYNDPELFIQVALRVVSLRTWQKRECDRIKARLDAGERNVRILVRACHGAGKTFFAAALLLWWMVTRYNSRGLTTAPTWTQVETALWPEIAKLYNGSLMRALGFGRLLDTELNFGETWFAVGASSDRPEHLEGQHSDFAAVRIVDEAKAVDDAVFEATEGLLTAPESLDLWISTPSIQAGAFYKRDMEGSDSVLRSVIDIDQLVDDQLLTPDERGRFASWKAERVADWGVDSPEYQSRVLGLYADNAEGALFPASWIERAMAQTFEVAAPLMVGMDVAGSVNGDANAVAVAAGPDAEDRFEIKHPVSSWHERDTMISKGRALVIARAILAPLRVDVIGLGKGVADAARQDGQTTQEYRASDKPSGPVQEVARFSNRKAQDAWRVRTLLEAGKLRLPVNQKLKAEMQAMRYEILATGKLRVIDPDDSPDLVDAVIIALASPSSTTMDWLNRFNKPPASTPPTDPGHSAEARFGFGGGR
jgi:phage terminase large subunit